MTASLHVAHYAPGDAARMVRRMIRHRRAGVATPGLAAGRPCLTADLDAFAGGTPRLTRWAMLCGWESAEARDELAPGVLEPFLEGAREVWNLSLDTTRVVNGSSWHGWKPETDEVEPLRRGEPVAVLTYGILRARHLPAFTWNNAKVVRELIPQPGHLMTIGLADHVMARATFSVWRSQGEMVRFAYGAGLHKPVQRRSLDVPWARDWFFARFRPVASTGTLGGRDPLAGALSAPPARAGAGTPRP